MPITEKQRISRAGRLGSSDMAAILGLDPYRNAYDVWLDKTGKLEPEEPNPAMKAGSMFERGVLQYAEEQLGKLRRNQYRSAEGLPVGSSIDAIVVKTQEPVEAKTAGLFGPLKAGWRDAGTDEVPEATVFQCHVHMLCISAPLCHVAAFIGGRGFNLFMVPRDDEVVDLIAREAVSFWEGNVKADVPPENVVPDLHVVRRVRRVPETEANVPDDYVRAWELAKDDVKFARAKKDEAEARILATLDTCEGGICSFGKLTYFEQHRKGYTVEPGRYRVLRLKKEKK